MSFDSLKYNIVDLLASPFRGGVYRVLFYLLIALLCLQIARLVWIVITPVGPVGNWSKNGVTTMNPGQKNVIFSNIDPFFRDDSQRANSNIITSLDLILFGTRMNEGSGGGSAIIALADGEQYSYAVGDEIAPNATLFAVEFDHVIIDRGGAKESLYLDQSIPAENVGGAATTSTVSQALASTSITSAAIRSGINFVPRTESGKITGIAVSPNGSANGALTFTDVGFLAGDVIISINGTSIGSAADIASLQSQFTPGARLSIMVERGADIIPVSINLEE